MCRDRGAWGISVPFDQFCCEPKTALTNNLFFKKTWSLACKEKLGVTFSLNPLGSNLSAQKK